MTAIELVLADGTHRRVDSDHDPELLWALRGGLGNFGVVTAIEFRLFPAAESVRRLAGLGLANAHPWLEQNAERIPIG